MILNWIKLKKFSLFKSKDINLNDSLGLYLKDIGQEKLLTREEEIELANTIKNAWVS